MVGDKLLDDLPKPQTPSHTPQIRRRGGGRCCHGKMGHEKVEGFLSYEKGYELNIEEKRERTCERKEFFCWRIVEIRGRVSMVHRVIL